MKIALTIVGFFVTILAIGWIVQGNDFFMYKYFAPKYEQARRETYEQTKSYRQGSTQRLNTLCTQLDQTDDDHKTMIKDVINQEFSEWKTEDVPDYLHRCLTSSRGY